MKNTMIKRATILLMSGTMAFTAFMAPAMATRVSANDGTGVYAEDNMTVKEMEEKAVVTVSAARVRESGGTEYRVVNKLAEGTEFVVTGRLMKDGEATNWYRVETTDQTFGGETSGYIHKSTFEFKNAQETSKATNTNLEDGKYYTVTGTKNYLALRSECKYDDDNEKIWLKNGDQVMKLADAKNGYVKVQAIDGAGDPIEGYVNASYLK